MSRIFIVAGHVDHSDPGAVANNTTEHFEVKRIALYIIERVKELPEFDLYNFHLVPTEKTLIEKIRYINGMQQAGDLVISIHMNAAGSDRATGTETLYLGGNTESERKAKLFQKGTVSILGLTDRGVKPDTSTRHGRLGIIRDTIPEAFLIEEGFITNTNDLQRVHAVGGDAVIEGLRELLHLRPTDHLDKLRSYEKQLDQILIEGRQLTEWEHELVVRRKKWDLQLDKVRGALLQEIKAHRETLHQQFVQFETENMRNLALKNNDYIDAYEREVAKREDWDKDVEKLRALIKAYFR